MLLPLHEVRDSPWEERDASIQATQLAGQVVIGWSW